MEKFVTDIRNNKRFERDEVKFAMSKNEEWDVVNVYPDIEKQEWLGLGGALTGSTIHNLRKLKDDKQNEIIKGYFKDLNYNIVRLPIGSTDFSVKSIKDYHENFDENVEYLNRIKNENDIKILATPWSPPARFKTIPMLLGGIGLSKKHYEDYANYLVNFINDYKNRGIDINFLCVQNEPFARQLWESCKYSIEELNDFTYNYLIPKLENTKIIVWDHNKENLYNTFNALYNGNEKVKGIAFHWYSGGFYDELEIIRNKYPDIYLIETEMCCGFSNYDENNWIGAGELYINEIIKSVNHGLNSFIDWNMLLDHKGGPNHKHNNCTSPLLLNEDGNDYVKTPIYRYLQHIGMAGAGKIIATSNYERYDDLQTIAIKNDKVYLTIMNKGNDEKKINIKINDRYVKDKISAHSIITFVF